MARDDFQLTKLQGGALALLADGPLYIRSLQAKGLMAVGRHLVDLGLAEKCGTPTNKWKNRIRLTPAGAAMLDRVSPRDARGERAAGEAAAANAGRSDRPVQARGGRVQPPAPADEISGVGLAAMLEAACERSGQSKSKFLAPLTNHPSQMLTTLRRTAQPSEATVERCRRFLRGEPIDPPPAQKHVRAKQPQSLRGAHQVDDGAAARAERLALSHRAADERRGGETLAEAFRRCAQEVEAEEMARESEQASPALPGRRAFQPLSTERWGQLAALAARLGVGQQAALDLALGVGIAGLNEDLDEEEAG